MFEGYAGAAVGVDGEGLADRLPYAGAADCVFLVIEKS